MAISLGQEESRPTSCGGLEEGDAAATLECLYCPTSRSHFQHLHLFVFAFVPGRDRGRVGWPIGLGVGCSPYPEPDASGHASTGGCAAGCCTCACCCPAAAQGASAGATSGAGCAKSGAGSCAGAAWTWCSTAHVERAVRQRREQRRLPGSGVFNCASWE